MTFISDFHVHSKFSRATSAISDLEHMYIAAQTKGITVLGTGDFTHPGWLAELKDKLEPAEPGLFRLRKETQTLCDPRVPESCRRPVRFMLTSEISCIYKKGGQTRKNHNLVLFSNIQAAETFSHKLSKIGNIESDGRPILGLDARDLLEIVLETEKQGCLIPAHIWTPWFSVLGSKSGFDGIEACFDDLTPYIFAVETGLSSDPPMNWRVGFLDGLTLVSNSDAHSPQKIGREANLFDTELSYSGIMGALKTGDPQRFLGTIEFFPEEGKYHLDGHRKCGISLRPQDALDLQGRCPSCHKPLTLGVLHRVECLADRPAGYKPLNGKPFYHLIPLDEVLAEIYRVGPKTQKVRSVYDRLIRRFGPEYHIMRQLPTLELKKTGFHLESEAIERIRLRKVITIPGYDGQYGRITVFNSIDMNTSADQGNLSSNSPVNDICFKDRAAGCR